MSGRVYLVGAGPGDPGLITVKGRQCIEAADVVIYDYLASPALLAYAKSGAERIYVGKKGGDHTLSQDGINALLIEKARTGGIVTRLKGGDPYIFGRGGEEAEALVAEGIGFEVVPGVTSAVAGPAYAGIPLTHRDFTSTVAFVTGHEDPGKTGSAIDWKALATGIGTLVFFMGVKNLPNIVAKLLEHGMPPDKPAAVVRWGTTPAQRTVVDTLSGIEAAVKRARIQAPALIVFGDVVRLRDQLKWFENRPLFGRRIVVTRAREQASDLVLRLTELGADCLEVPTIRIEPPGPGGPMDQAIGRLDGYDWIIFTSANGVRFFFDRLFALGRDARALGRLKTAVIGPATAERLMAFGVGSDLVPESFRAESIVEAFAAVDMAGKRVLLPRALEARAVLPDELRKMGAAVDEVPAYRTVAEPEGGEALVAALEDRSVDMVTFTSSSTVQHFKALLPADRPKDLMDGVTVASIGPITTETAKRLGFDVHVAAETFTIPGLVAAVCAHYRR